MTSDRNDPRENWPKLMFASILCLFLCFVDVAWFGLAGFDATAAQLILVSVIACLLLYCGRHIGAILAFNKSVSCN